tara:strand:- start:3470 stop:3940 length:471 start_codon:yes stop_codon:yes gene_type:complete
MIFGGGATGLLGTLFSRVFDMVDKHQERQFIIKKYRLDADLRAKEMESEERIVEVKGYSDMLTASYLHDSGIGQGAPWVVNLLRLVRPTITLLLWVLVGSIWFSIMGEIQATANALPWLAEKSTILKEQIVGSIVYCATAATLWWFGTRDMRKTSR